VNTSYPSVNRCDIQLETGTYPGSNNINIDPEFTAGPFGDAYLSHTAKRAISPCIDVGSNDSDQTCFSPQSTLCMSDLTTNPDHTLDGSILDLGFHYDPSASIPTETPTPTPTPVGSVRRVPSEYANIQSAPPPTDVNPF